MSDAKFTSHIPVELVDCNFSDGRVCVAARTSTAGADARDDATGGLISSLMRNRHGSPFEHMNATWRVTAPLFVWREHHRHRIASYNEESARFKVSYNEESARFKVSYNEESARFKVLEPRFYFPGPNRPLVQVGKAMDYDVQPGDPAQHDLILMMIQQASTDAYATYQALLNLGVAREVARDVLPVNIMSTCIVTP